MNCIIVHKENIVRYGAVNPKYIQSAMLHHLRPILEKWSNTKLVDRIGVYGFRRYLRGSTLKFHVDRLPTHIISAILQVHTNYIPKFYLNRYSL